MDALLQAAEGLDTVPWEQKKSAALSRWVVGAGLLHVQHQVLVQFLVQFLVQVLLLFRFFYFTCNLDSEVAL